ncbi:hypothetical protein HC256_003034 [Beauveria bassiana]|nr:hypothetical protein HC256_003034 [Beauveria bassiana]
MILSAVDGSILSVGPRRIILPTSDSLLEEMVQELGEVVLVHLRTLALLRKAELAGRERPGLGRCETAELVNDPVADQGRIAFQVRFGARLPQHLANKVENTVKVLHSSTVIEGNQRERVFGRETVVGH